VSALGIQEAPNPKSGTWGTRDPVLACILGTLDFLMRSHLPVAIVYDGRKIVTASKKGNVDTETGQVDELATVEMVFSFEADSKILGRINCSQVAKCYRLAQLRQKNQITKGGLDSSERMELDDLKTRCKGLDTLANVVQLLNDQICNWNVLCNVIQELNENPFIKFTRAIKRGVASTLNPLEVEGTANRRSERLFRAA
jgi:hypothetical protein